MTIINPLKRILAEMGIEPATSYSQVCNTTDGTELWDSAEAMMATEGATDTKFNCLNTRETFAQKTSSYLTNADFSLCVL